MERLTGFEPAKKGFEDPHLKPLGYSRKKFH